MNNLKKCGFCLILFAFNAFTLSAQVQDALVITEQGNVNVPNGKLQEKGNDLLPKGSIILWYGTVTNVPGGWAVCDGNNNTPNLSGRFVVGAGNGYDQGSTGGNASITLTENNLPAHSHGLDLKTGDVNDSKPHITGIHYSDSYSGGTTADLLYYFRGNQYRSQQFYIYATAHTHDVKGDTKSTGGGQAFDNRPPFYALYYIMKL